MGRQLLIFENSPAIMVKNKSGGFCMNAIETVELTKKYRDVVAVDRLTLQIRQGELYSLLGTNGAGKTTAIKLLSCLTAPSAGDAFLLGRSIRHDPQGVKRIIGVSPQQTAVAPNLSVRENLELLCGIYGLTGKEGRQRTEELTRLFGLQEVLSRKAGKLSGGWQRRVSIAMAIIGRPAILFLDEPTLGLDVMARRELWQIIRDLKGCTTVILTTHYMEEAEALSDRIGILQHGQLLTQGTARQLMAQAGKDRFEDAFITIVKGDCL